MKRVGNSDFRCTHCKAYVISDPAFAGVKHRNHCPYCLWSRHLDLLVPGDRLSACKAAMQPVGLTFKISPKKYNQRPGELMLCHQCTECGRISINRIAADDDPHQLYLLFAGDADGNHKKAHPVRDLSLRDDFIRILDWYDQDMVQASLFGVAGRF